MNKSNYIEIMRRMHQKPIYVFPVHRDLMKTMAGGAVLSLIMDLLASTDKDEVYHWDWAIQRELNISKNEFRYAKAALKSQPFLKITLRGCPPQTFYSINWDKYFEAAFKCIEARKRERTHENQDEKGVLPTTGERHSYVGADISGIHTIKLVDSTQMNTNKTNTNSKKKKNTLSAPRVRGKPTALQDTTKIQDKRFESYARMLANTISKVHKVNCTSKIKNWAKDFELLHRVDGADTSRIKKVLKWYDEYLPLHHRERYCFIVESGSKFRDRFLQMEAFILKSTFEGNSEGEEMNESSPGSAPEVRTRVVGKTLSGKELEDFLERSEAEEYEK